MSEDVTLSLSERLDATIQLIEQMDAHMDEGGRVSYANVRDLLEIIETLTEVVRASTQCPICQGTGLAVIAGLRDRCECQPPPDLAS